MTRLTAIILLGWLACTGNGTPAQRTPDQPDVLAQGSADMTTKTTKPGAAPASGAVNTDAVVKKLLALGYLELFQRMDHDEADALWRDSPAALEALVTSDGQPGLARFLAAEILYLKKPGFPSAAERPALAAIYAEALAQTGRQSGTWNLAGNMWGLTYVSDDVGEAGKHLLGLGTDATAALKPLLANTEGVLYEGSEEATVGNEQLYRVKDLAAYFLGRIHQKPVTFHADWKARDREIDKLAKSLP
jgi:hypothetical protein